MTITEILSLIGFPSLSAAVITWLITSAQRQKAEIEAVKKGTQALLRSEMISMWNKYSERDGVPIYVKENFENCWQQYHSLGANGVMDGIHDDFMALPLE